MKQEHRYIIIGAKQLSREAYWNYPDVAYTAAPDAGLDKYGDRR